jgi:outer membrane protein
MKRTIIITLLLSAMMTAAGIAIYHIAFRPRTAYVDSGILFRDFSMKQQLEQEYKTLENERNAILDSLELSLRRMGNELSGPSSGNRELAYRFELGKKHYQDKQEEFAQQNEAMSHRYDEQIWTRINQYVEEYGDRYRYTYIYGLTGDGSIMYAQKGNDITAEVLKYINDSYEGKK